MGINLKNPIGDAPVIKIDNGAGDSASADQILLKKATSEVISIDVNGLPTFASNGQLYEYMPVFVGDIAADADALVTPLFKPDAQITLFKCYYVVDTDIGADAVNYQTLLIEDDSDNSICSITTAAAQTGGVLVDFGALSADKVIDSTENVQLQITKTASGKALSGLLIYLVYTCTA